MKPYRPELGDLPGGGVEQSFRANVVHVEDELVAFGDLIPDSARGLPYGTPVHSLLVHIGEDGLEMIELNDQGNSVMTDAVKKVELSRDEVRFYFRAGAGPLAGRVALAREIEVFEDVPFKSVSLAAVRVRFDVDDVRFDSLRSHLAPLWNSRS
jgi:hypothetical protein